AVEKLFNGDPKYQELYRRQQELEGKLVVVVEEKEGKKKEAVLNYFVDVLKEPPKDHVIDKLFQGDSMAQMEMMVLTMRYYHEAIDQVLSLPVKERSEKIAQFEKTILFYRHLVDGNLRKDWIKKLGEKAKQMKEGEKQDGLRKMMGDAKDFVQDKMNSALTVLLGGSEESLIVWMHQKAIALERKLSRPIQPNDPEVLEALESELVESLDSIAEDIKPTDLDMALKACEDIRAVPSKKLTYSEAKAFKDAMGTFLDDVVFPTQQKIISAHSEIMQNAYTYSNGEDSILTSDSLLRGKLAQSKGQDVWRTIQVLSPFGILLPKDVELKPYKERFAEFDSEMSKEGKGDDCYMFWSEKGEMFPKHLKGWKTFTNEQKHYYFKTKRRGGLDNIKIKSYWDTGFWEDHELLSMAAQGGLSYLTVRGGVPFAYHVAKGLGSLVGKKVPLLSKLVKKVPKKTPPALGKFGRIAWQVWLGYEIGDFINGQILNSMDESIQEDIKEYLDKWGIGSEWPEAEAQDIRLRVLRDAILHKKGYFQAPGYDLTKLGMTFGYRHWITLGDGDEDFDLLPPYSMVKTGEFREALIEANFILNSIGLEPFIVDIDL
ncbi:hypothetical protein HON58_01635, partial [Candidatus Peregrinibacteria bacterium]|nr:hypothetical protein [Candidatus Peregrinibacteria bacterium]